MAESEPRHRNGCAGRVTRRGLIAAAALCTLSRPLHATSDSVPPDAARLLLTGFRGTSASDPEVDQVLRHLAAGSIVGVLLLRRNIVSPEQLLKLTHAMRQAASPHMPIIAIDQEGGAVSRLDATNGFSPWPSASEVAAQDLSDEELHDLYATRVREMAFVGINLNLGPVLDLNVNPRNPIIGALGRSYGRDPEAVARHAAAFVRAHRTAGVLTCSKHYPGHGSSTTDSHLQRTEINLSWTSAELLPFRMLIERNGMDSLMTAHVIHRRFSDDGNTPVCAFRDDPVGDSDLIRSPIPI